MATDHFYQTWPVSDLTFVEIAVEQPLQTQMHVRFDCGACIIVTHKDQIPLAAELIDYLRNRPQTRGSDHCPSSEN